MNLIEKYLGEGRRRRMNPKDSPRGKAKKYIQKYNVSKDKKWLEKVKKTLNVLPQEKIDAFIKNNMDEAKKSQSSQLQCMECGHKFKKKIGRGTVEVKCPKCKGYDTEPV